MFQLHPVPRRSPSFLTSGSVVESKIQVLLTFRPVSKNECRLRTLVRCDLILSFKSYLVTGRTKSVDFIWEPCVTVLLSLLGPLSFPKVLRRSPLGSRAPDNDRTPVDSGTELRGDP